MEKANEKPINALRKLVKNPELSKGLLKWEVTYNIALLTPTVAENPE